MKMGRNAPCPCGSGKKYKKCCLALEEQKAVEERLQKANVQEKIMAEASGLNKNEDHEDGPDEENEVETEKSESDRIWDEFLAGDFNQKAVTLEKLLDNPDLLDEFDCFELFSSLHDACQDSNDRKIFKTLTQRLKEEYPDEHYDILKYLQQYGIHDALVENNKTNADNLFLEFAENADIDIDMFNSMLDQMICLSDLDLLLRAMHKGWDTVKNSSNIVPWGIDEYANLAAEYEIFKYISQVSDPDPADPDFIKKLEKFIDPAVETLETYIPYILGTSGKEWTPDDFNYQKNKSKSKKKKKGKSKAPEKKSLSVETFSENVSYFTTEFLGYLTRKEKFSFPKADIARSALKSYIIKRAQGELEKEPSIFREIKQPGLKNKKPPSPSFENILCPDKKTFDIFLGSMLSLFSFRLFRAVMVFETIPAWLRFIESKGFIDHEMRHKTMSSIYELYEDMRKIIKGEDKQFLIENIEKAYPDSQE